LRISRYFTTFAEEIRKNLQMSSEITKHTPQPNLVRARTKSFESLLSDVRQIIENGLQQAYLSINLTMLHTYWNVGKRIIEDE
jgi:TRAP-type C4-dicarboxylate transport system substrate-binding protein